MRASCQTGDGGGGQSGEEEAVLGGRMHAHPAYTPLRANLADSGDVRSKFAVGTPSSAVDLPVPRLTRPVNFRGKGGKGPESGPISWHEEEEEEEEEREEMYKFFS